MTHAYSLADLVTSFFASYLPGERGFSRHTIVSYRDTFRLLLAFVMERSGHPVTQITMDDISAAVVTAFLEHLEEARGNAVSTRNVRLAALRTFFAYAGQKEPSALALARNVALVPFKRGPTRRMEYLNAEEVKAILDGPDRETADGRREYLTLALLYDTGARAQEILSLRPSDFRLHRHALVTIRGKGNKERLVPLLQATADLTTQHLAETGRPIDDGTQLIRNRHGQPMTRSGLTYLVAKYRRLAAETTPSLERSGISPHTFRHTKAMHLLQAGVHPVTIKDILGHAHLETLSVYARADLDLKRRALEQLGTNTDATPRPTQRDPDLLEWLERL
ncbi:MAG: integrase [Proteobacteria bacterium]|nr:MAG: integrase [Pseudomonadota bacterium]PIE17117.1 MAG: integrase [Pseudomonadota bacterium]